METRQRQRLLLEEVIVEWKRRLEKALLSVENSRRRVHGQSMLPEDTLVWMPEGPNARLNLLTLKTWCIRYCVAPEFILDVLTIAYRNIRKDGGVPRTIYLGLPAGVITGPRARKIIEDAVLKTYPNGENRKAAFQPRPRIPKREWDIDDIDKALRQYTRSMKTARKNFELQVRRQRFREVYVRRNFRKI